MYKYLACSLVYLCYYSVCIGLRKVVPRGKFPLLILFLVWHLASTCTDRERKKKRGFTFSLFALMHSLKWKPRINNESHGLTRSCGEFTPNMSHSKANMVSVYVGHEKTKLQFS